MKSNARTVAARATARSSLASRAAASAAVGLRRAADRVRAVFAAADSALVSCTCAAREEESARGEMDQRKHREQGRV